jgi:hypothetical protein
VGLTIKITILMVAKAGEELFFGSAHEQGCESDLVRSRATASETFGAKESVDAFVHLAFVGAKAILRRHRGAVLNVATVLVREADLRSHADRRARRGRRRPPNSPRRAPAA